MSSQRDYLVVYEFTGKNWAAYLPDIPNCIAAGDTVEETRELMKGALKLFLESMEADGSPLPQPRAVSETIRL